MIYLSPLADNFSIYQLPVGSLIPSEIFEASFYSITRTNDEISIVTNCKIQLSHGRVNENWKGFKVEGPLDFSLVGILYEITKPLKENHISVFVISTFDTDYILVKEDSFEKAVEIFKNTQNIEITSK